MPFVTVKDGRIQSEKLEYNVVEHCNYSCDECSHLSPYLPRRFPEFGDFQRDLTALARVYRVRRFRFVGGEPLLRKDIGAFIAAVRQSGIAGSIEICTNGSLLHTVNDDVFQQIDRLAISWYPDERCDQAKIDLAKRKCSQFSVDLKVERINRFRIMQIDRANGDEPLRQQIYRSCLIAHSWGCQTFYDGRFYMCSRPLFTVAYLEKLGIRAPDLPSMDGCPLHEGDLLPRLLAYLSRHAPLESCRYCLGTVGKYVQWRQLASNERKVPSRPERDAKKCISRVRLAYLLTCARAELAVLRILPSQKVNRLLNLAKIIIIRD
jgi:Radical SAM superfamily